MRFVAYKNIEVMSRVFSVAGIEDRDRKKWNQATEKRKS